MKLCLKCNKFKSLDRFNIRSFLNGRYNNRCIECQNKILEDDNKIVKMKRRSSRKTWPSNKNKPLQDQKYRNSHRDYINEKRRDKRRHNVMFRLACNLRKRTSKAFKGLNKSEKTLEMLGCDLEYLRNYFEPLFTLGMTWENYGKWHVDHIVPLSSAKNEKELKKLCHYSNLQPLSAQDNFRKGNRLITDNLNESTSFMERI